MSNLNVAEEEDELSLCPSTLAALQEFYSEREERERLQNSSTSNEVFDENWVGFEFKYFDYYLQSKNIVFR